MAQILGYTAMLLRAYTRDWVALFFGFFFPLIFMSLFGVLNFGSFGHVSVGVADEANNNDSAQLTSAFSRIETLQIHRGAREAELADESRAVAVLRLIDDADGHVAERSEVQHAEEAHEDEREEEAEEERDPVSRVRAQQHRRVAEDLSHLSRPAARGR